MRVLVTILALALCISVYAQDLPATVAKKFEAWQQSNPSFRTIGVFAQDKYVPGDTVFFNAWFLTEDGRLVGGRQILNLDMIDSDGAVVQHILFRVVDGTGANQIVINPDTRPGVYVMSIYNDCMRASDPRYVYRKQITVVRHNAIAVQPKLQPAIPSSLCKVRVSPLGDNIQAMVSFPTKNEQTDSDLVLVVTANGQLYYTAGFKRNNRDSLLIRLPKKDLPEGLNLASVLNSNGVLLCSRHFYNPSPSPVQCNIRVFDDTIATKQNIVSHVTLTDRSGKPLQGQFSVVVSNGNLGEDNVVDSEINVVSELSDVFALNDQSRNRYLANQPAIVPWDRVLSAKPTARVKPPALITKYGDVYFESSNKPVPIGTIINCFMKRSRFSFGAEVGEEGRVEMLFLDFFGKDEMFYYAEHDGKELDDVKIRWVEERIVQGPSVRSSEVGRRDQYAAFTTNRNVIDRSFNFFSTAQDSATASTIPLEAEFENQGTVVNLHDYRVFPTMGETIRELIPRLAYRRIGGKEAVRVNLSEVNLKVLGDPLYVIDGEVTKSTEYFLSLVPGDLVSIRVIFDSGQLKRFMPVSRNGIVVVKTKKRVNLKENILEISGLSESHNFNQKINSNPVFRSTIAWIPMIKTDANGKASFSFYSTDDTGKVKITVKGVVNGQMFSATHELFVKFYSN